ncbi:MAG: Mrp/NBP35 family ATP-binding protein [Clostridia bacterium]|nr:Mrp/NBP35 family ATP-binding protein [Clostridia bacterium]
MADCNHDCSGCSKDCASREQKSLIEKLHPASNVKKVIAVLSGKGGVGKSMVTSLLAVNTQRAGYRAAILDADMTGPSIPQAFGIHEKAVGTEEALFASRSRTGVQMMSINLLLPDETAPVVWRGPVIAGAVKQFWRDVVWQDVDYMYVDMPPGTGDVPLTVLQSLPVAGIVVVTSPQELVGMIVEKAVKMADMLHVPILGIVENMAYFECPDCGKRHYLFGQSHLKDIARRNGIESIAQLPLDPKLTAAVDEGLVEFFEGDYLKDLTAAVIAKA